MPKRLFPRLNSQRGAVLLMVLIAVTLLGLVAGITGSSWRTIVQRSKEADLLWKGSQIRKAIGRYYEASQPQGLVPKTFPPALESLVHDPRFLEVKRHLRRLYLDPMTGEKWEIIKAPDGRVMGVRSRSDKMPFKQRGFCEANRNFSGQLNYKNWQFIYQPQTSAQPKKTTTKTGP